MTTSLTPKPLFATPSIATETRPDGSIVLRSTDPLQPCASSLAELLRQWAVAAPDRVLAAQGDEASGGWQTVTYGQARAAADALAQAFLDRGLGPDRPVMVLSGNSVKHLLVTLAGYTAGVPVAPVSVAYSLQSRDHARLRALAELVAPGLVFADDGAAFAPALEVFGDAAVMVARNPQPGWLLLDDLSRTVPTGAVEDAAAAVTPDTVAKLLFTSGSTGTPKGVINTHGMLCANQQMIAQAWPFLAEEPPVLVDWLPWSHTFGGNHNVHLVLRNGGSLYVDSGRPAPALFGRSVAALTDIPPTVYLNVPAGFAMLAPTLERDPEFAARFFSRLRLMFYAAAALPEALMERLHAVAKATTGREVPFTSAWGATETSPAVTYAHFDGAVPGCLGVPLPGDSVKLAPTGRKLEIRVKGPNITPGYLHRPDLTAAAFDEEGYYRTGDAARMVDPEDPNRGLVFDGRIAEDFKLITGTWVHTGAVRTALLSAAGGVLTDAVIAGHDRASVTALAWVNAAEAAKLLGTTDPAAETDLSSPILRGHLSTALATLNEGAGSASRVERLLLLSEPPSLDHGEITDKGYINQHEVLTRRAHLIELLYTSPPDAQLIHPGGEPDQPST